MAQDREDRAQREDLAQLVDLHLRFPGLGLLAPHVFPAGYQGDIAPHIQRIVGFVDDADERAVVEEILGIPPLLVMVEPKFVPESQIPLFVGIADKTLVDHGVLSNQRVVDRLQAP